MTKEQEKAMLEEEAKEIELQIAAIKRQIGELRSGTAVQWPYPYTNPSMIYGGFSYSHPAMDEVPLGPEEELASLESYKKHLDDEMKGVQARIDELKKQTTRSSVGTDETAEGRR